MSPAFSPEARWPRHVGDWMYELLPALSRRITENINSVGDRPDVSQVHRS